MNKAILSFFNWTYYNAYAEKIAYNADYISIPFNVANTIETYWEEKLGYN